LQKLTALRAGLESTSSIVEESAYGVRKEVAAYRRGRGLSQARDARTVVRSALAHVARARELLLEALANPGDLRPGTVAPATARLASGTLALDVGMNAGVAPVYGGHALIVAERGASFRLPRGVQVDLRTKRHERAVLYALACARIDSPGRSLTRIELLSAGWPDEQVRIPRSGANRVHVTVATLRGRGLRDILKRDAGGYHLDPKVPIVLVGELI
jgi:hypothetical protein